MGANPTAVQVQTISATPSPVSSPRSAEEERPERPERPERQGTAKAQARGPHPPSTTSLKTSMLEGGGGRIGVRSPRLRGKAKGERASPRMPHPHSPLQAKERGAARVGVPRSQGVPQFRGGGRVALPPGTGMHPMHGGPGEMHPQGSLSLFRGPHDHLFLGNASHASAPAKSSNMIIDRVPSTHK